MSKCALLVELKKQIENGEDPEIVIPYNFNCKTKEEYIELLYFAWQVLPEGRRKEACYKKLEELNEIG